MLINFKGQSDKNFLLHKPNGESPKPVEAKKDSPEKKPEDKNDFSDAKNRLNLYEQAKQAISKLKARPDKTSQDKANDLQHKLDTAQAFEKMGIDEFKIDLAYKLKSKLDSISQASTVKPLSDKEAKRLMDELDKMNKKDTEASKPKPVAVAKADTMVFTEDKITAPKPTRKETLDDARTFGMIGLLDPNEKPQPAFGEKKAEKQREKPLEVKVVSMPKIDAKSEVVIGPSYNTPDALRQAAKSYVIANPGVEGYRYFQANSGEMWRANIKPGPDSSTGTLIEYKKVSIIPKKESASA